MLAIMRPGQLKASMLIHWVLAIESVILVEERNGYGFG